MSIAAEYSGYCPTVPVPLGQWLLSQRRRTVRSMRIWMMDRDRGGSHALRRPTDYTLPHVILP
jgi:hypothetical protein